jgi:hypothetical protein
MLLDVYRHRATSTRLMQADCSFSAAFEIEGMHGIAGQSNRIPSHENMGMEEISRTLSGTVKIWRLCS